MRQVWSVFKPPWPFDPYHPTFRVQALFLCWYVKNEVAESQIGSCFPLDRHATTNFGHYVGTLERWTLDSLIHTWTTRHTGWTQGKIFGPNFYIHAFYSAVACPCISQSSHGPSIFSKLAWPLYIFKAHMAHIKFSLTKSWTFKSGSLPLILLTLASWLFEHSFLRSPKAMCRFRSSFVHLRLLVRELYAVKDRCLHRWG